MSKQFTYSPSKPRLSPSKSIDDIRRQKATLTRVKSYISPSKPDKFIISDTEIKLNKLQQIERKLTDFIGWSLLKLDKIQTKTGNKKKKFMQPELPKSASVEQLPPVKKFRRMKKRPTLKKRPKPSPPKRKPRPRPITQETLILTPEKEPSIESSSSSESCDLYGELMEGFENETRP